MRSAQEREVAETGLDDDVGAVLQVPAMGHRYILHSEAGRQC